MSSILSYGSLVLTASPGGLAGCVIAGRLTEADPNLSILVIEQGPDNFEEPQVVHPALYPRNLFPSSNFTLFWQGNKSPQLADRSPIVRTDLARLTLAKKVS